MSSRGATDGDAAEIGSMQTSLCSDISEALRDFGEFKAAPSETLRLGVMLTRWTKGRFWNGATAPHVGPFLVLSVKRYGAIPVASVKQAS